MAEQNFTDITSSEITPVAIYVYDPVDDNYKPLNWDGNPDLVVFGDISSISLEASALYTDTGTDFAPLEK